MNVFKFVASLVPSFERRQMSEDVDRLRSIVTDTLQPALKQAQQIVGHKKLSAAVSASFNELFQHALPAYRRYDFFEGLARIFKDVPAKLDMLDSLIDQSFAKDVTKEAMTYKKASILQYLNTLNFVVDYTGKALLRYVAAETAMHNQAPDSVDGQLAPAEKLWLDQNVGAYATALKLIAEPVSKIKKTLEGIPDITVNDAKKQVVKATVGDAQLDPLKFNLLGMDRVTNPIYHFRAFAAEYKVRAYKQKLEEKRQLELRLLALKEAYHGKQNPKLAQNIEYSEGRLKRLNYELEHTAEHALSHGG